MARGRTPTPIETRQRQGDRSKRATPQPVTVGGRTTTIPDPPDGLDATMRAIWRQVVGDLIQGRVFDMADRYVVEGFCVALGRARQARRELARPITKAERDAGKTTRLLADTVRGTWTTNPLLTLERDSIREARLLAGELGLSPIARTRLGLKTRDRGNLAGLRDQVGAPTRKDRPSLAIVGGRPQAQDDDDDDD